MKLSKLLLATAAVGLILLLLSRWMTSTPTGAVQPSADTSAVSPGEHVPLDRVTLNSPPPAVIEQQRVEAEPVPVEPEPASAADHSASFLVVRASDGAPILGATLWTGGRRDEQALGTSDETGLITVDEATAPGDDSQRLQAILWFKAEGFSTRYVEEYDRVKAGTTPLRVELLRSARLDVFVTDADGAPVEGSGVLVRATTMYSSSPEVTSFYNGDVFISISSSGEMGEVSVAGGERWARTTDSTGYAAFDELPSDEPLALSAGGRGWPAIEHPGLLNLSPATLESVELSLPRLFDVRGVVVDAATGAPLPELAMSAVRMSPLDGSDYGPVVSSLWGEDRSFSSGPDGTFELAGLTEGLWYLGAAEHRDSPLPPEEQVSSAMHRLRIAAGEDLDEVVLRLHRGLFVTGVVVDSEGAPVRDVHLSISYGPYRLSGQPARCAADGTFRIGPLEPGPGELRVVSPASAEATPPLSVSAGDTGVVVALVTSPALEVTLVDEEGELLLIHDLVISRDGQGSTMITPGRAEPRAIRLDRPTSDPLDVFVTGPDSWVGSRAGLQPGSPTAPPRYEIVARAAAQVHVSCKSAEEFVNVRVFGDGIPVAFDALTPGQPKTFPVPPGSITVRAEADGQIIEEHRVLRSGEEWEFEAEF